MIKVLSSIVDAFLMSTSFPPLLSKVFIMQLRSLCLEGFLKAPVGMQLVGLTVSAIYRQGKYWITLIGIITKSLEHIWHLLAYFFFLTQSVDKDVASTQSI